jgi:phospholipid transport system substrate-binding protein
VLKARIDRLLAGLLDYQEIASRALGDHWTALRTEQRDAFLALFSPLTNQALLSAAERRVAVRYDSETVMTTDAIVVATPQLPSAPPSVVQRLEYRLGRHADRWLVYDVVVDGVSLVDGYRGQFERLLRRGTFDDVLALMRHKLDSVAAR